MSVATKAEFTGDFPGAPPRSGLLALTSSPDGGWTHVSGPKGIHRSGVTFFCFVDGDDGHIKVGEFTHATDAVTLTTVATAPDIDIHSAPSIEIRPSDDRLVVAWTGHNSSSLSMAISTNVLDASVWGSAVDLDSQLGGSIYTYASLGIISTTIYLFYRDRVGPGLTAGRVCYSTSTDGGATWATQTVLASESGRTPYFVIDSDGSRLDVAVSTGSPDVDDPSTVHHLYTTGSGWLEADGTSLGSPTFSVSSLPSVYDSGDGPAWPGGVTSDGPALTYMADAGADYEHRFAEWTGSAWSLRVISGVGQDSIVEAVSVPVDGDTVYGSLLVSGVMELRRWDRATGWAEYPVTGGSTDPNVTPAKIKDAPADRRVLWLRGANDASRAVDAAR